MSDHGSPDADHTSHEAHGGIAKYVYVFLALCVLTSASITTNTDWWQQHFDQKFSWALMMAVSCSKALLVILFFMHVKYEANWKYVLTIPAGLMSIFLILMLVPDIGNRNKKEGLGGTVSAETRMKQGNTQEAEEIYSQIEGKD